MSAVHIHTRATKSGVRFIVRYRDGGRKSPLIHVGSFRLWSEAEACKERVESALAIRATPARRTADKPRVYFAELGDLVKIGVSVDPERRCRTLNASVRLTLPGGRRKERELHQRFADDRVRGEWFRQSADILEFIEEVERGHRKREGTRKRFETIARQNAEFDASRACEQRTEGR